MSPHGDIIKVARHKFLGCRFTFSHKNPQLFHKVAAVTVRTELSGEPRLASAARYLFSS